MSGGNVTPIRSDSANPGQAQTSDKPMPSRELIDKRLEVQRDRIFRAQNIVDVVAEVLNARDDQDCHLWGCLTVIREILDGAAENLQACMVLHTTD